MRSRQILGRGAEILAAWSIAVAQPLYDLLARNPEFFAVRGTTILEAALLVSILSLALPLAVIASYSWLATIAPRAAAGAHHVFLGILLSALALNSVKTLPAGAVVLIGAAVASGIALATAIARFSPLRQVVRLLAATALLFPLLFFWNVPRATWNLGAEALDFEAPRPRDPAPIVFVIFDELPLASLLSEDGMIDAVSFPNFAALAERSTWFRSAATVSDFTTTAIPALLTGSYPRPTAQPTTADYPVNLFTILGPHYRIKATESLTRLCPVEICGREDTSIVANLRSLGSDLSLVLLHLVLPLELAANLPPVDQTWKSFGQTDEAPSEAGGDEYWEEVFRERAYGDRAASFQRFLAGIERRASPTLYYYASFLPHVPFTYKPSGRLYSTDGRARGLLRGEQWGSDEWAITQTYQRHLLQLGFVDRQLGTLVQHLEDQQVYDSAMLIITADHGVSFRANDSRRQLTTSNYADIMGVPLFIKFPGQSEGRIDDTVVETVDVLPTILEVLGMRLDLPIDFDGQSLAAARSVERAKYRFVPKGTSEVRRFSAGDFTRRVHETVERRLEIFGTDGFDTRFFQVGEFGHLVGRSQGDFRILEASDLEIEYTLPVQGLHFDPRRGLVPAHITGRVTGSAGDKLPHLAVGINGTIRAVSRVWLDPRGLAPGSWSAVVSEDSFLPGENLVENFLIDPDGDEVRLVRPRNAAAASSDVGRPLGVRSALDIEESGFHVTETWGTDVKARWTNGHGRLEIPRSDEAIAMVRIDLLSTGPHGTQLTIAIDGMTMVSEFASPGPWSRALPLLEQDGNETIVLEIKSDTFVPSEVTPESRDRRTLGVALGGVWLLSEGSE